MISVSGLGATLALQVIDRTKPQQLESIERAPQHARAIENFRKAIEGIETVEDLVQNYDAYNLVMKANGLGDQMFGKAMVREILSSDISKSDSLVRRMTDDRFESLYRDMGFTEGGAKTENTKSVIWQEKMIAKYIETTFVDAQAEQDPIVGNVLKFRSEAPQITKWYDILGDADVAGVLRLALGIPNETATLDVDRQVDLFKSKMALEDLQDPDFLRGIERKYSAIAEAQSYSSSQQVSPIVQMFQSNGDFVSVTIDITSLSGFSASTIYR